MLKNQRGITLVALVITIIILIILATVAISFAFGDSGLINRSQMAADYTANDEATTSTALNTAVEDFDKRLNTVFTED